MVTFGADGGLTWRKLIAALYNLFLKNLLPEKFSITGIDDRSLPDPDIKKLA
jgi:glucose-6-phosphate 1-dehydrogenase